MTLGAFQMHEVEDIAESHICSIARVTASPCNPCTLHRPKNAACSRRRQCSSANELSVFWPPSTNTRRGKIQNGEAPVQMYTRMCTCERACRRRRGSRWSVQNNIAIPVEPVCTRVPSDILQATRRQSVVELRAMTHF